MAETQLSGCEQSTSTIQQPIAPRVGRERTTLPITLRRSTRQTQPPDYLHY